MEPEVSINERLLMLTSPSVVASTLALMLFASVGGPI